MNSLLFSANAVMPLILVATLGFVLKKKGIFSDSFLESVNKFIFDVGFMMVLFINVYKIPSLDHIRWEVIGFVLGIYILLFFLGKIYIRFFVKDIKQKWVMHECFFRSSFATVGIPLINSVTGQEGLAIASIVAAFSIPVSNILAIVSYSEARDGNSTRQPHSFKKNVIEIVTNPYILGVATGLIFVFLRPYFGTWRFSTSKIRFIYTAIDGIAQMTPWLALLMIGGQFSVSIDKTRLLKIIIGTLVKVFIAPTLAILIALFLPTKLGFKPFGAPEMICFVAFFGTPAAISTIRMSEQIGSDKILAEQIVVWTSLCVGFFLFIDVIVLTQIGIFN